MNTHHEQPVVPAIPSHHVPDLMLLEHLSGHQDEAVSLAIACHLAMCQPCRAQARGLNTFGGVLLDAEPPQQLKADALDRLFRRADSLPGGGLADAAAPASATPPPQLTRLGLPSLLFGRLPSGAIRWRYVAPGVRGIDVALESHDTTVRLVRLKPGLVIPKHDHGAPEVTLVFTGALTDAGGRFARGDLSFRSPGETHVQRVDPGGDCVALVVNGGSLVPLTWAGRLLRLIARP